MDDSLGLVDLYFDGGCSVFGNDAIFLRAVVAAHA